MSAISKEQFEQIKAKAEGYRADMTKFLRDLIRIPSESCEEEGVIKRIAEEMNKVGFDKVDIDPMGNVLGYMGTGKTLIGIDAHIDTVGIGNKDNWKFDPYEGYENDIEIGGRGTSDQERFRSFKRQIPSCCCWYCTRRRLRWFMLGIHL